MSDQHSNITLQWEFPSDHDGAAQILADQIREMRIEIPGLGPLLTEKPIRITRHAWLKVVGAETPKKELLVLLSFAAEVEHSLMVQYLYAMASLDENGSTATQNLRDTIRDIAIQEMAHFISVQNLLLAVGGVGAIHTGRDGLWSRSKSNPLPFSLEPVSELTLAEYVLAESPEDLKNDPNSRVSKLRAMVMAKANLDPQHVGAFYRQIYWLLQPDDLPHGTLSLTPDPSRGLIAGWHLQPGDYTSAAVIAAHQALPGEWHTDSSPGMLVLPLGDASSTPNDIASIALINVAQIMEQGEGALPAEGSHFERFLEALDSLADGNINILALPRTPFVDQAPPPTDAPKPTKLVREYTTLWSQLFNCRYSMLPLDIGLALQTPIGNQDRDTLVDWAFASGMRLLSQMMEILTSDVLRNIEPCGPTFGLLLDGLPFAPAQWWTSYRDLLLAEADVIAGLERRSELASNVIATGIVAKVKANSAVRLAFVRNKIGS